MKGRMIHMFSKIDTVKVALQCWKHLVTSQKPCCNGCTC